MTEADTCREFVTPKLVEAGWGAAESVIGEQQAFGRLQAEVFALKAKHAAIREGNAALMPATLERVFQS